VDCEKRYTNKSIEFLAFWYTSWMWSDTCCCL